MASKVVAPPPYTYFQVQMGSFINGVISRVAILISYIRGLIPPLVTTHEPPSRGSIVVPFQSS